MVLRGPLSRAPACMAEACSRVASCHYEGALSDRASTAPTPSMPLWARSGLNAHLSSNPDAVSTFHHTGIEDSFFGSRLQFLEMGA